MVSRRTRHRVCDAAPARLPNLATGAQRADDQHMTDDPSRFRDAVAGDLDAGLRILTHIKTVPAAASTLGSFRAGDGQTEELT